MSNTDVVADLMDLERLAEQAPDIATRRTLERIYQNITERAGGAKVADAAHLLNVSPPTVRSWIEAGVLEEIPGRTPRRVTLGSLVAAKRAVDEVRSHADNRRLLAQVARILRDRAALVGSEEGFDDYAAGRLTRVTPKLLDELRGSG